MARRSYLLKSSVSSCLFEDFVSSYQRFQPADPSNMPFVFVDTAGSVRLLTNVVNESGSGDGIFAVSMGEDGWMEFLALQE